jgi:hypothetical protein
MVEFIRYFAFLKKSVSAEGDMMSRTIASCIIVLAVSGCATRAVISDLEEDKVKVQASGNDMTVIRAEAQKGCAVHDRSPVQISYRCLDGYCIQKEYLFACN